MLCRLPVHQLWYALSSATLLKVIKVALFLMLIILVVDFKEFTKTSFVSKLKAHPCKVHIAIVVGTRNVGHLKRRGPYPTEANGSRTGRGM